MTPQRFSAFTNIDIADFRNRDDDVRHAAIDKMRTFFCAVSDQIHIELQIFRFTHLQRYEFAVQLAANQTGRRLK